MPKVPSTKRSHSRRRVGILVALSSVPCGSQASARQRRPIDPLTAGPLIRQNLAAGITGERFGPDGAMHRHGPVAQLDSADSVDLAEGLRAWVALLALANKAQAIHAIVHFELSARFELGCRQHLEPDSSHSSPYVSVKETRVDG